nr:proline-rich proteoglycan 2-like [Marmota flaviventris]
MSAEPGTVLDAAQTAAPMSLPDSPGDPEEKALEHSLRALTFRGWGEDGSLQSPGPTSSSWDPEIPSRVRDRLGATQRQLCTKETENQGPGTQLRLLLSRPLPRPVAGGEKAAAAEPGRNLFAPASPAGLPAPLTCWLGFGSALQQVRVARSRPGPRRTAQPWARSLRRPPPGGARGAQLPRQAPPPRPRPDTPPGGPAPGPCWRGGHAPRPASSSRLQVAPRRKPAAVLPNGPPPSASRPHPLAAFPGPPILPASSSSSKAAPARLSQATPRPRPFPAGSRRLPRPRPRCPTQGAGPGPALAAQGGCIRVQPGDGVGAAGARRFLKKNEQLPLVEVLSGSRLEAKLL